MNKTIQLSNGNVIEIADGKLRLLEKQNQEQLALWEKPEYVIKKSIDFWGDVEQVKGVLKLKKYHQVPASNIRASFKGIYSLDLDEIIPIAYSEIDVYDHGFVLHLEEGQEARRRDGTSFQLIECFLGEKVFYGRYLHLSTESSCLLLGLDGEFAEDINGRRICSVGKFSVELESGEFLYLSGL